MGGAAACNVEVGNVSDDEDGAFVVVTGSGSRSPVERLGILSPADSENASAAAPAQASGKANDVKKKGEETGEGHNDEGAYPVTFQTELSTLAAMGFNDTAMLRPLLHRHGGDVQRAIYELVGHQMDPAWTRAPEPAQ